MLYPRQNDRQAWLVRMVAIAAGFSAASFAIGSVVVGRLATPLGLLVALVAGAIYALGIGALYAPRRVGSTSPHHGTRVRLSAPANPPDPR